MVRGDAGIAPFFFLSPLRLPPTRWPCPPLPFRCWESKEEENEELGMGLAKLAIVLLKKEGAFSSLGRSLRFGVALWSRPPIPPENPADNFE